MSSPQNLAMVASLQATFRQKFGDSEGLHFAMAPGRVNLLGEYTDINDGFVLPTTVDKGVYVALRERHDFTVCLYSARYDYSVNYQLNDCPTCEAGSWSSYVVGVIEELRARGLIEHGFECVIDGDLLLGAGLSSSAALEVATATALQHLTGFVMNPVEMVKLCQYVEHTYARVFCGIMDQFASRICKVDHALLLDCRTLDYKATPMALGENRIVIVNSGVKRSLAASTYNTRRAECQEGLEYFKGIDADVVALRDVSVDMFDAQGDELADNVRRRCRHVITENIRVLEAFTHLAAGQVAEFGTLMDESHRSLRDDFEVSCAELDVLTSVAGRIDGVFGARMTGAGFGGCTVNLVHADAIPELVTTLETEYMAQFKQTPDIFVLSGNLEAGPLSPI